MKGINRRQLLGGVVAGAAASVTVLNADHAMAAAEVKRAAKRRKLREFKNEEFYTPEGKFDVEAAKKAYYEMMRYYQYPIPERLRGPDFWTLDFGMGKFMEVGMAGIFWINNKEYGFFGHEIYLLPGQMIPEHAHVKTADGPAKMEGWHVRYGWVYIYGEGTPTEGVEARIPPSHKKCAKARTEKILKPGECACLGKPEEKHWMHAGPEGAIVSEYATWHDMAGLRFSHPDAKL
jgi:D-lyxose ketol-isomerase